MKKSHAKFLYCDNRHEFLPGATLLTMPRFSISIGGGGGNYCTEEKYIPSKGLPFGYVNLWLGINTIPPPEDKYFQKTVYFLLPVCVYTYLCPWLFWLHFWLFLFFCFCTWPYFYFCSVLFSVISLALSLCYISQSNQDYISSLAVSYFLLTQVFYRPHLGPIYIAI